MTIVLSKFPLWEARTICKCLFNCEYEQIISGKVSLSSSQTQMVARLLSQKQNGIPIEISMRKAEFDGKVFYNGSVSRFKRVLSPRFDTQVLLDRSIHAITSYQKPVVKVLEIGCGSGALSICLAQNSNTFVDAIDISPAAICITRNNIRRNGVKNVNVKKVDVKDFRPKKKYDIIISNPPYIPRSDIWKSLQKSVSAYEPENALIASDCGMEFYKEIARVSELCNPKHVILEIGMGQLKSVSRIFERARWKLVDAQKDENEIIRCLTFSRYVLN